MCIVSFVLVLFYFQKKIWHDYTILPSQLRYFKYKFQQDGKRVWQVNWFCLLMNIDEILYSKVCEFFILTDNVVIPWIYSFYNKMISWIWCVSLLANIRSLKKNYIYKSSMQSGRTFSYHKYRKVWAEKVTTCSAL